MSNLKQTLAYIDEQQQEHLAKLFTLLKQPSISTTGEGVRTCAKLLVDLMQEQGINARIMETEGHPVVYGEVISDPDALTILMYGHYDVQPPEPLEAWESPPFEPTVREGKIYGRGSGDNKGQMFAHVLGAGSLIKNNAWPNVNVKFLFDGEEECSSPSLPAFLAKHKDLLQADVAISSDGPKHDSGRPVIFFGVRGLVYVELFAKGAATDLHSGNKGGVVPTPAWELVHLLNLMYGPDKKCNIPGFYDNVLAPSEYEEELIRNMPFDKEQFLKHTGLADTYFDNVTFWRTIMFNPTFNICGLTSGYQGDGSKTIIPAKASAKLDMRLVPNQKPERIVRLFKDFVKKHAPNVEVVTHGSYPPSRTPVKLPICQAVIEAVREASDEEPVIQPRLGGSTPDYLLSQHLGLPSIWVPYANADENNHAPNENINLKDFYLGIRTTATVLHRLAEFNISE